MVLNDPRRADIHASVVTPAPFVLGCWLEPRPIFAATLVASYGGMPKEPAGLHYCPACDKNQPHTEHYSNTAQGKKREALICDVCNAYND
ncbi:hypothetical protein [Occultella gossypii]|uniref:Uncharacterized protein n=1 Tax=Occultella gossypii TaxID=2800820 RepID=A0ABS7S4Y6_9MICO|nr:hypothetical protein [Occultella gossypii]MBZ2195406.1 hypothetical protein [Occultella gossypii]